MIFCELGTCNAGIVSDWLGAMVRRQKLKPRAERCIESLSQRPPMLLMQCIQAFFFFFLIACNATDLFNS